MNRPLSTPATWDSVLATVKNAGARGLTNAQIAALLGADPVDVSSLTRLLWKAMELDVRKDGMSNIYTYKTPTTGAAA